jgi:hypothetical protein
VLIAVLAIHLALVSALIDALRQRKPLVATASIVSTLIYLPPRPHRATPPVHAQTARKPSDKSPAPTEPAPQVPPQGVGETAQTEKPVDWGANARQAALDVLKAESIDLRRSSKMGEGWLLAQENSHHHASPHKPFPWSHQPLTSWVDVDPDTFVITFRLGRRCQVVFLVVAAVGCVVGPLDPEPGRNDLFDPIYRPQPLELPEPAIPFALPELAISEPRPSDPGYINFAFDSSAPAPASPSRPDRR